MSGWRLSFGNLGIHSNAAFYRRGQQVAAPPVMASGLLPDSKLATTGWNGVENGKLEMWLDARLFDGPLRLRDGSTTPVVHCRQRTTTPAGSALTVLEPQLDSVGTETKAVKGFDSSIFCQADDRD
jgi:hypothetical protein